MMRSVRQIVSVVAVSSAMALAAAACRKEVPPQTPAPPPPAPVAVAPPAPPPPPPPPPPAPKPTPAPKPLTEEEIFARKSLRELNDERPLADVFFDLDESTIRDGARPLLQKNADWMNRWTSTQVTVEGHCDSRGSAEYNLALGTRRGDAVKSYLVNLGVPASRITVVSKGKEQPVCSGDNEGCWQQNRRGHFLITAK